MSLESKKKLYPDEKYLCPDCGVLNYGFGGCCALCGAWPPKRKQMNQRQMEGGYPIPVMIDCPNCGAEQLAAVEFYVGDPFPIYIHKCKFCAYTIMESEWNPIRK